MLLDTKEAVDAALGEGLVVFAHVDAVPSLPAGVRPLRWPPTGTMSGDARRGQPV